LQSPSRWLAVLGVCALSLIAVAGFARVPVLTAVRALLVPVVSGLVVATVCAVFIW